MAAIHLYKTSIGKYDPICVKLDTKLSLSKITLRGKDEEEKFTTSIFCLAVFCIL